MSRSKSAFSAGFEGTEVVLDLGGSFSLRLPSERSNADTFLVLDIYDLDNPVHPDGHVGWWRFEIEQLPEKLDGSLVRGTDGTVVLKIDGAVAVDRWQNPNRIVASRLELLVVVRNTITNAILSIDRVPVVQSNLELQNLRSLAERVFQENQYVSHDHRLRSDRTIHIVSRSIFERDAVGNLCLALYGLLLRHGVPAKLYADEFRIAMNDIIDRRSSLSTRVGPNDVILFCFSTYDPGLEEVLGLKCCRHIAYHHGITSPRLLQVFDTEMGAQCAKAARQLPWLAKFDRVVTNSLANAAKLRETLSAFGVPSSGEIEVIPPKIFSERELRWREMSSDKQMPVVPNFLYVGRIVSHKRIEDLLCLVAEYRELDPLVSCTIVGSAAAPAYRDYLDWVQTQHLGLPARAVIWLGNVPENELARAYRESTVYVSMSEDEGFCLPILEAMMQDNLVFAYDLPAIRELMGDSGVIFSDKSYSDIARRIHDLLGSPAARRQILGAQRQRAIDIAKKMDGGSFLELLAGPVSS
jgi:glycosyltransferase involved in cell wall biosynthesis